MADDTLRQHPDAQSEREKFIMAFNDTMIKIWQEQITLLGVIDTKHLLDSVKALPVRADGRFYEVGLSQLFTEYGLWQDYGTGREVPRGNSGDIGRTKKRQRRPWFSRKYYGSVMRLNEFLADNMGHEFVGIVSAALSGRTFVTIPNKTYLAGARFFVSLPLQNTSYYV